MADDASQQRLQPNHQAHLDPGQDPCHQAIHQRAIDEDVAVVLPPKAGARTFSSNKTTSSRERATHIALQITSNTKLRTEMQP
jgi:hypothetical protein